mmetsp:Transcript_83969/g.232694  ORF Transcript_83969/g.232694 Transcript_83969/m.232694 type:complete len:274 (+) Transcript_83969:917-1738(+)
MDVRLLVRELLLHHDVPVRLGHLPGAVDEHARDHVQNADDDEADVEDVEQAVAGAQLHDRGHVVAPVLAAGNSHEEREEHRWEAAEVELNQLGVPVVQADVCALQVAGRPVEEDEAEDVHHEEDDHQSPEQLHDGAEDEEHHETEVVHGLHQPWPARGAQEVDDPQDPHGREVRQGVRPVVARLDYELGRGHEHDDQVGDVPVALDAEEEVPAVRRHAQGQLHQEERLEAEAHAEDQRVAAAGRRAAQALDLLPDPDVHLPRNANGVGHDHGH